MKDYDPNDSIDYIYKNSDAYADAYSQVQQLEAFKHHLKASKMSESSEQTAWAKEMVALASEEYKTLCEAIGQANRNEKALRWKLESAKMRWETWRTQEASNRNIERMTK